MRTGLHIANYRIVEEEGFPQPDFRGNANMGAKGACVIPTDLVTNVEWLHQFLFEDAAYTVFAVLSLYLKCYIVLRTGLHI